MTLPVVHATGDPRALGRAQGEAFASSIHATCDFYRRLTATEGRDIHTMAERALPYLEVARRRVPELVEELEGLIEGAAITLEEGLFLSCMEEVWEGEGCTTMSHGRYLLHAENWYAGHSAVGVVVAQPDDGPSFVSPTNVGFLPAVGMSSAGFAQGVDSLTAADDRVGVPRVLLSRLALGAPGLTAAVAAACTEERAGGYAYVFVSSERTVVVETSGTRHAMVEARSHTNHYLASELAGVGPGASAGSSSRLRRAQCLLDDEPPESLEDCARVLADHDGAPETICLHEEGLDASATVFGMACDLVTGRMIVSEGPPCAGRWEEHAVPTSRAEARRVG